MDQGTICNVLLRERGEALYLVDANEPARRLLGLPASGSPTGSLAEHVPELAERILPLLQRGLPALGAVEDVVLLHLEGKPQRLELRLTRLADQVLATFRSSPGFRQFMELSLDMLAVVNSRGYFEEVSHYFAECLGYTSDELCAEPFLSFVHAADRESTMAKFQELLNGGSAIGFANRYRRKDGQYRWLSWHASAPDMTGRLYAVARDITAENERSHTRIILERALRGLHVGIVLTDRQARVEWCNPRLCEMTGYSMAELVGQRIGPTLHGPDTDRQEVSRLRACIAQGVSFSTLLVNYHKSGRPYWVEIEAQPLEYDGALHFLAVEQDVTDRVGARLALTRSEQRFRQALEGSRDAIYLLDAVRDGAGEIVDFVFAEVNVAAESELGLRREQLIGQHLCTRFPINREARFFERYRQVACGAPPFAQEYEIPSTGTAPGFYRHFVAKLHDGVVIFNQNLTETRARERERETLLETLRQAQKMEALGQLASAVAHDFNNSLAVMRGTADALAVHAAQDTDATSLVNELCGAIDRARSFVRRLLDFARPAVVRHEPIDLSQLTDELCRATQRTFPAGIALRWDLRPGLVIKAGSGQIDQIVGNILANARDAVAGRGQISVQLRDELCEGAHVALLEIKDDGSGMTAEVLARFTDPFFTTKAGHGGLGLGMATVLGVVRALAGRLDAESSPGAGTTIRISIPRVQETPAAEARMAQRRSPSLQGARLLLVDDNPRVGELLSRVLVKSGFAVSLVTSAGEAMVWAEGQTMSPDVAIVDYMMPEMNGVELAQKLHARWPRLPLLLATGAGIHEPQVEDSGIQGILYKPFSVGELLERIESLLRAS